MSNVVEANVLTKHSYQYMDWMCNLGVFDIFNSGVWLHAFLTLILNINCHLHALAHLTVSVIG
jgi:hypothetical protein